jgi:hypothetical protein
MNTQPNPLRKWGYFFSISWLTQIALCGTLLVATLKAIERDEKLQSFIADANQGDLMSKRDCYQFGLAASRDWTGTRKDDLTVLLILSTV